MWIELLCGFLVYKFLRFFFYDDDVLGVETSDSDSIFSVASRLEKLYGGKVFAGLRIPDADTASLQNIDIVLVTKGEAVLVSVINLAGFVTVNSDRSWSCISHKDKEERLPDPVEDARRQVGILEAYLEQRGISLPEGFMSCKVIIPNPKFRSLDLDRFPPEVIPYEQWVQLKPDSKSMLSGWIKGAFRAGKKEMQESIQQQLNVVLSTAPMWDRLEFKGDRYLLGEFLEFNGKSEDIKALQHIKRSRVGQVIVQRTSMLGLAPKKLQVLSSGRDYRTEAAGSSEWKEVTVRSSTEVVFQPCGSKKVRKIKLSSVTSLTLSA